MKPIVGKALSLAFLLVSSHVYATSYSVPPSSASLIGEMKYAYTSSGDNVVNIAQRYDVGYNSIDDANPQLDMSHGFPAGSTVAIPTQHLLPNAPRQGIIVNLPEMRMYYFPAGTGEVLTYPIGIGKIGKTIPITKTSITYKKEDPVWIPPQDIREFNLKQGIVLPSVMPPGPDNPLGPYAIYMRVPTYLIHSTIFPESVGKRASFGCLRMYESDIQDFFPSITGGIPVEIVNMPTKVGWENNALYVEVHKPLEEHSGTYDASFPGIIHKIVSITGNRPTLVDWQAVYFIAKEKDGVPHNIGIRI